MKNLFKVFVLTSLMASSLHADKVVNLTCVEWVPFVSQTLYKDGFANAVIKASFAAVDIDVEYEFLPGERALFYAEKGMGHKNNRLDGSFLWSHSAEREEKFFYSDPICSDNTVAYFLKDLNFSFRDEDTYRGLKIGTVSIMPTPYLDVASKDGLVKLEKVGNHSVLFDRLMNKRIDVVIQNQLNAEYHLKRRYNLDPENSVIGSQVVYKKSYYLLLTRKYAENEALMEKFNEGLKIIKENGLYDSLKHKLDSGRFYVHEKTPENLSF